MKDMHCCLVHYLLFVVIRYSLVQNFWIFYIKQNVTFYLSTNPMKHILYIVHWWLIHLCHRPALLYTYVIYKQGLHPKSIWQPDSKQALCMKYVHTVRTKRHAVEYTQQTTSWSSVDGLISQLRRPQIISLTMHLSNFHIWKQLIFLSLYLHLNQHLGSPLEPDL